MSDRKWNNPVNSQMGSKVPSMTPANAQMDHMEAPFGKPHDTGNGGIPLKIYDTLGNPKQGTKITDTNTAGLSAPSAQGPVRKTERAAPPKNRK